MRPCVAAIYICLLKNCRVYVVGCWLVNFGILGLKVFENISRLCVIIKEVRTN